MAIRPELSSVFPVVHGDIDYGELVRLDLHPDDVIDFSTNSNPYAPDSAVLEAVREAVTRQSLRRYPDRDCMALRQVIAEVERVAPQYILPTNGANELIQLIALAFVTPTTSHLIIGPTFGEYARAIRVIGGAVREYRPTAHDLRFDVDAIVSLIQKTQPHTIWLCNPNNPTGQFLDQQMLQTLYQAVSQQTVWIIDESYAHFAVQAEGDGPSLAGAILQQEEQRANVICVRSLTKLHSLAGLRLGYAVAVPQIIEILGAVQPAWSVNSLAQVAGMAALQPAVMARQLQNLSRLRKSALKLWKALSTLSYPVLPTDTHYALIEVEQAAEFRRDLLTYGILVRDCTSFGLPDHIRVAAQLPEHNERLLTVMKKMK